MNNFLRLISLPIICLSFGCTLCDLGLKKDCGQAPVQAVPAQVSETVTVPGSSSTVTRPPAHSEDHIYEGVPSGTTVRGYAYPSGKAVNHSADGS